MLVWRERPAHVAMWQARMLQKYSLSPRIQQRPWIGNAYRSVTCKFSKSCGPVRYAPRSTNQPKNPSTQHDVEETNKHVPPMPSLARRFQDPGHAESLHLNCKQNGETCTQDGFSLDEEEEEESRATTYDREYAAEWRDKGSRHPHKSSADLAVSITTQQTFGTEATKNAGSISILENGLASAVEKAQTNTKNPFACMTSNVERKTCPQAVKSIPSLPILGKHPVRREPDFQEGKWMPCKDVENFLLKVQKAKRRGLEPLYKSHAATSDSFYIDDNNNNERDDSDDDRCLFLGQDTLDEREDIDGVNFKDLVVNSTAAQEHAKNQAIRYLAMRPYTALQLRKKLESRNITSELVDYALDTVQKCGLQSDLEYAKTFSRARFNHGSWGPQRIKLGLKQRGISNEIIQAAIASVFREEENDCEQYGTSENDTKSNSVEMSRAAMDHLLVQATKQWKRGRDATNETKIRRMVSWLQYRGYNYSVINIVLKHLQQKIRIEDE